MEKALKTIDDDRISALPDELLSHILSFLPTRESAATSLLSTRWKYLFASVSDIDLEFDDDLPSRPNALERFDKANDPHRQFLDFINLGKRLVLLRNGAPIKKFRLSLWWANEKFRVALNSLISAALSCELQELEICIGTSHYTRRLSPLQIFKCKTLTSLKLNWRQQVVLRAPKLVSLPNLKVLHLVVRLEHQDSIRRLIRGCPLLDELSIAFHCPKEDDGGAEVGVVDFSSTSMKKLILNFCGGVCTIFVESTSLQSLDYQVDVYEEHEVIVNTPNLKYLCYQAPLVGENFFRNMDSLVEAKLRLGLAGLMRIQPPVKHLNRLQTVQLLCLQEQVLEGLYFSRHLLPTFKNLTRLGLEANRSGIAVDNIHSWKTLQSLLEKSPNLEALVFDRVIWCSICEDEKLERLFLAVLPICSINHLKEIEITEFKRNEYEFKLVEYLLQNGNALKKITLGGYLLPSVCERILSFKRCSKDCQIVLNELEIVWRSSTSDECSYKTKTG